MDVTETPEYHAGKAWADANLNQLRERYSGAEINTVELRSFLWNRAERVYPEQRESLENSLRQSYWFAGAIRRLIDTMPMEPAALAAVFEVAMEVGSAISAERTAHRHLESLRRKPASWWKTKFGDASPNDIMKAVYSKWWRDVGIRTERTKTTKWEVLIYGMGARELAAFDTIEEAKFRKDGDYEHWEVSGEEGGMDIMAKDVWQGNVLVQGAGEIVG